MISHQSQSLQSSNLLLFHPLNTLEISDTERIRLPPEEKSITMIYLSSTVLCSRCQPNRWIRIDWIDWQNRVPPSLPLFPSSKLRTSEGIIYNDFHHITGCFLRWNTVDSIQLRSGQNTCKNCILLYELTQDGQVRTVDRNDREEEIIVLPLPPMSSYMEDDGWSPISFIHWPLSFPPFKIPWIHPWSFLLLSPSTIIPF